MPFESEYPQDKSHGWLGLLSCSTSASSSFLGIVPHLVRRSLDSSDGVQHVQFRRFVLGADRHTLSFGARVGIRAKLSKVTIVDGQTLQSRMSGPRHLILNESPALLAAGYIASCARVAVYTCLGWAFDDSPEWDPKAKVAIAGTSTDSQLLRFDFKHNSSDRSFSVFLRGNKAVIYEGLSILDAKPEAIKECIWGSQSSIRSTVLKLRDGGDEVKITVTEHSVLQATMFDVLVDLVPDKRSGSKAVQMAVLTQHRLTP